MREKREKKGEKEKKRETERNREKKREKGRKRENKREKMSRVNCYQSAFNSQKEKLNILAEMLKISKSGCCCADL